MITKEPSSKDSEAADITEEKNVNPSTQARRNSEKKRLSEALRQNLLRRKGKPISS